MEKGAPSVYIPGPGGNAGSIDEMVRSVVKHEIEPLQKGIETLKGDVKERG